MMTTKRLNRLPLACSGFLAFAATIGNAGAIVSIVEIENPLQILNFRLTDRTISFDIRGVFPLVETAPSVYVNSLFFVNTTFPAGSFSPANLLGADSISYSGMGNTPVVATTGSVIYGDYFFVNFGDSFAPGQELDETFSAAWNSEAFDPSQISELDVFWGSSDLRLADGGIHITTVAVPEPSAPLLAVVAVAGLLIGRRRVS